MSQSNPSQKWFIAVAGNIGVGKSTLTQLLGERLGWQPFFEAVDENPYLQDFYADMAQWSFHSQVYFLSRRLQHHRQLLDHPGHVIQDRSIYEDAEIFAKNLALQGKLSERDYRCYRDLYVGIGAFLPPPHLLIYLQAPVGVLAERIAMRGRDYERQISIDYLAQLNRLYDEWVESWTACPIFTIPAATYDFVHRPADLEQVTTELLARLEAIRLRQSSRRGDTHS
ncbi:MAG: deoxynucleoside kinase [Chloroflexi bacterium]|nr:deoxynucleoside kinase [Chloroflexota bacterium]